MAIKIVVGFVIDTKFMAEIIMGELTPIVTTQGFIVIITKLSQCNKLTMDLFAYSQYLPVTFMLSVNKDMPASITKG